MTRAPHSPTGPTGLLPHEVGVIDCLYVTGVVLSVSALLQRVLE